MGLFNWQTCRRIKSEKTSLAGGVWNGQHDESGNGWAAPCFMQGAINSLIKGSIPLFPVLPFSFTYSSHIDFLIKINWFFHSFTFYLYIPCPFFDKKDPSISLVYIPLSACFALLPSLCVLSTHLSIWLFGKYHGMCMVHQRTGAIGVRWWRLFILKRAEHGAVLKV